MEIKYIRGKNNIVVDALSQLRNNGNQRTTYKYNYTMEIIP